MSFTWMPITINTNNQPKIIIDTIYRNLSRRLPITNKNTIYELTERSVYVIRFNKIYTINYPKRHSPVLYIGEGYLENRIRSHLRNWLFNLSNEIKNYTYDLYVSFPRQKKCYEFYKCIEASLLQRFIDSYGKIPLCNRQNEYINQEHDIEDIDNRLLDEALNIHKGTQRYKWTIEPIHQNILYESYLK